MDVGDLGGEHDVIVVQGGYLPLDMFAHTELFAELRETGPAVLMLEITLS